MSIQSFWKFVLKLRYPWNQSTSPTVQSSYCAEDAEAYDASDSQDIPVPDVYLETVELHGRLFQKHALHHKIYFAPCDEVNAPHYPDLLKDAHAEDRKKHSASSCSTTYSTSSSIRDSYFRAQYPAHGASSTAALAQHHGLSMSLTPTHGVRLSVWILHLT